MTSQGLSRAIERSVKQVREALAPGARSPLATMANESGAVAFGLAARDGAQWSERRYSNVASEAFPFLDLRTDGCHYALWIDAPSAELEPPVVFVSPTDGAPDTLRLVANSFGDFLALVARAGLHRDGDDALVARMQARAASARIGKVTHATRDGIGVVAGDEPAMDRPDGDTLAGWRRDGGGALIAAMERWTREGARGLALAVARDVIAEHDAEGIEGFNEALARVYRSMNRELLARVPR